MNYENMFRLGSKMHKTLAKTAKNKAALRINLSPVKTLYLWEKHTLRKIELFSME